MGRWTVPLFFAVEVLVLGALFFVLPRIGRRGLLFGVYVGEEHARSDEAAAIRGSWYRGLALFVVICLALLAAAGAFAPLATAFAPLLLVAAFAWSYVRAHLAARRLAVSTQAPAVAVLDETPPSAAWLPLLTIGLAIAVGAGLVGYTLSHYDALPAKVPVHFNAAGDPDRWTDKSPVSMFLLPVLASVMGGFLGFFSLLVLQAKRSLRYTDDPAPARAQERFRLAISRFLSGLALLVTAMFAFLGWASVDVARGARTSMGWAPMALAGAITAFAIGGVIYLMARYGQGGARLEGASAEAALTNGLADNRNWVLGVIYVNRDDPSIMVEKRFGLGYTINFGNPKAVVIFVGFLVIVLGIVIVAVTAG